MTWISKEKMQESDITNTISYETSMKQNFYKNIKATIDTKNTNITYSRPKLENITCRYFGNVLPLKIMTPPPPNKKARHRKKNVMTNKFTI